MDREKPGKRIVSHEELMEGIRKIEGRRSPRRSLPQVSI